MSIRTKLILWYSGLLAVIIVMFGVAVYGVTRWALLSTIDRTLESSIEQVLENSRASAIGQFGPPGQVTVALPQLDAFALSGVLVQVWDLSASSPNSRPTQVVSRPASCVSRASNASMRSTRVTGSVSVTRVSRSSLVRSSISPTETSVPRMVLGMRT